MKNAALRGRTYVGNSRVRFDEGKVASEKPRRGSLLDMFDKRIRQLLCVGVLVVILSPAIGADVVACMRESAVPSGFAAVRARVAVPERKALQRFCIEQLSLERVQMAHPTWIATNAHARLADVPFKTADGVMNRLTVVSSRRGMRPLRWTAEGAEAKSEAGEPDALAKIVSVAFPDGVGDSRLSSARKMLSRASTVIRRGMTKSLVDVPYNEFFFFLVDDLPEADWAHPARYVFVKSDLTAWTVLFEKEPASVESSGVPVTLAPSFKSLKSQSDGPKTRVDGAMRLSESSSSAAIVPVEGGDPSRCHALLVLGGADLDNNHRRYWNELAYVYNMMRKRFGLPRANIKVLWADGNPATDMCHNGICTSTADGNPCKGYAFVNDDLSDFDQDGNNDITGKATRANLKAAFDDYAEALSADDQLLVFFSDHGGAYGDEFDPSEPAVVWLWEEAVKDTELAKWTQGIRCPVVYALKTCYSGGMISETMASSKNRVMATADAFDPSMACSFVGYWTYYFFGALGGYYPAPLRDGGECSPFGAMNPRLAGDVCTGADADGDGRVSFYEAHLFACKMNPCTMENGRKGSAIDTPLFQESTVGLGKKMFLTKYTDVSPAVVREQVATPAFETEPNQFAPYLVRVSCATPGATIRYTLDGSEPTETSAVCNGGIEIESDATVTVRAFKSNMDGSSAASRRYTVRKTAPEAARIVSVSQSDSSTGIVIEWLAAAGAGSYDVLRAEVESMQGAKTLASKLSSDVLAFADMTAEPGRAYYYQVRSANAYGQTVSTVSQKAVLALNAPTDVTATLMGTAGLSSASIKIAWKSVEGATHYRVSRKGADGRPVDLGVWTSGTSYTDSVTYANGGASFTYYVRAAVDANGGHAGDQSEGVGITVVYNLAGASLEICLEQKDEAGVDAVAVKAGSTTTCYCKLRNADGSLDGKDFLSGLTWQVVSGNGLTLRSKNGSYSTNPAAVMFGNAYTPPSVSIVHDQGLGDCTVKVTYTLGDKSVSRELRVLKTDRDVIKTLTINSPPFAVPGEVRELWAYCTLYGSSSWRDDVPVGTEVKWSVIGEGGATVSEDGELTAWPVTEKTTVVVQAKVDTPLGPVVARQTVNVSPSVVQKMRAVIPPTGGESTNYVGAIDSVTYGEWENADWINGVTYYGSNSGNPKDITITVSLGKGRNQVSIGGKQLFFSFRADQNAEKDREALFKLRWDGGGVDFTVLQQQAPTAAKPTVRIEADGGLRASVVTTGAAVRYALDGEEPSETSPILDKKLLFDYDTAVATKSFGEWMQASETVYKIAPGQNEKEEEVTVSLTFDPVESGVTVPGKRQCKVSEKYGELPVLKKAGLYFKGWTLDKGSGKCVRTTDYVPRQDTTLFAVWSKVGADEPAWTALPWNFKSAMRATVVVVDKTTGERLDPSVCSVGIEDASSVCRGSTKNGFGDMASSENGKDGKHVFGVYGQVTDGMEDGLSVHVWHPDFGYVRVLNPTLTFTANGALGSDEMPYAVEVELVSDSPTGEISYGPGKSSTFALDSTTHAVVVGVAGLNARCFEPTLYCGNTWDMNGRPPSADRRYLCFTGDSELVDVEKDAQYGNQDDYWCSEFTDLNLAYFGGWIPVSKYADVDKVAAKLRSTYDADSQWTTFGWLNRNLSAFAVVETRLANQSDVGECVVEFESDFSEPDFRTFLEEQFDQAMRWVYLNVSGHAVACCGYSVDGNGRLNGLFVIDSDNDMFNNGGAEKAPNRIMYCPVREIGAGERSTYGGLPEGWLLIANIFAEEWTPLMSAHALRSVGEIGARRVIFDAAGGSVTLLSKEIVVGDPFGELPQPVRVGYSFGGWENDVYGSVTAKTIVSRDENVTLHARWLPNQYVVRFHGNGGKGQMAEQAFKYDEERQLSDNGFSNGKLYFAGWSTSDAGTVVYRNRARVKNLSDTDGDRIDLYAVWTDSPPEVEITFWSVGGYPNKQQFGIILGKDYDVAQGDVLPNQPFIDGYVFSGWYTRAEGGQRLGSSQAFRLDDPSVTDVYAQWIDPVLGCDDLWELQTGHMIEPIDVFFNGLNVPQITVKNLPPGLKFDSVAGFISGRPTKSGIFTAAVTATSSGRPGFRAVGSLTFVVRTYGEQFVTCDCDGTRGTVTGCGVYQTGKKVTLKAKANKGYVFSKWKAKSECAVRMFGAENANGTLTFVTTQGDDVELAAEFVTENEARESLSVTGDGLDFSAAKMTDSTNVLQGVYQQWHISANAKAQVTSIKVSGLPSGFKFSGTKPVTETIGSGKNKTVITNVPANTIYGYPSAASKKSKTDGKYVPSTVTITVTAAGKVSQKFTLQMTVCALPPWAVGTFTGMAEFNSEPIAMTMTIGSNGKISGSFSTYDEVTKKTLKWTCSANGFAEADYDPVKMATGGLNGKVTAKSGKHRKTVRFDLTNLGAEGTGLVLANIKGEIESPETGPDDEIDGWGSFDLYRNVWKDKGATAACEDMKGLYNVQLYDGNDGTSGYLSLKADAKGSVKIAGKLSDGTSISISAPFLVDLGSGFFMPCFIAPSAYKGGYVSCVMYFNYGSVSGEGSLLNRSPTANCEYGEPFFAEFKIVGAFYDPTDKLHDHYEALLFSADGAELAYTYKYTYSDEGRKVTESDPMWRASPAGGEVMSLDVTDKDKIVSPVKAGKPVKTEDGEWSYFADNIQDVKVTFTPATGIFKGSFVCWYDYLSALDESRDPAKETWSHTSKKYSFEGIWVQDPTRASEGNLSGFFVSDGVGIYDVLDKNGEPVVDKDGNVKQKTFKYKESHAVSLIPSASL